MRVIRTELYLDQELFDIPGFDSMSHNPGIGFAWFNTVGIDLDLSDVSGFSSLIDVTGSFSVINDFLLQSVVNYERRIVVSEIFNLNFDVSDSNIIVSHILQQSIIIERSPPLSFSLSSILNKSPAIAIGTFVGIQASADNGPLMMITVPGGILIVSAAIGVSKALEKGLNKAIEGAMKRHLGQMPNRINPK